MSNVTEPIFDAQAYLENVDPSQKYTIDVLAGGIMNLTFRGTKAGDLKGGRFPEHMSLVMKYAPPYIAGMGSGYPLTTYRQVSDTSFGQALGVSRSQLRTGN
jgi:hypothetical protein